MDEHRVVDAPRPVRGATVPMAGTAGTTATGPRPSSALPARPAPASRRRQPRRSDGHQHVGVNGDGPGPVEVPTPTCTSADTEAFVAAGLAAADPLVLGNRRVGYRVAKRAVDVVGAAALLVVTSPVIALLALLIRLDSPGPALFSQDRVTAGGRHFRFWKFRTMYVDARERFPELYAYRFADGDADATYYKLADDPRNTRVGRWLRTTTLDELPNLWNVLVGDMSLVGPRPDLPELVRRYRPEELACLQVKAGVTGLAQVSGRSLLTVRERLTLDVHYVAEQSLATDLRILASTVRVVVAREGAF